MLVITSRSSHRCNNPPQEHQQEGALETDEVFFTTHNLNIKAKSDRTRRFRTHDIRLKMLFLTEIEQMNWIAILPVGRLIKAAMCCGWQPDDASPHRAPTTMGYLDGPFREKPRVAKKIRSS